MTHYNLRPRNHSVPCQHLLGRAARRSEDGRSGALYLAAPLFSLSRGLLTLESSCGRGVGTPFH